MISDCDHLWLRHAPPTSNMPIASNNGPAIRPCPTSSGHSMCSIPMDDAKFARLAVGGGPPVDTHAQSLLVTAAAQIDSPARMVQCGDGGRILVMTSAQHGKFGARREYPPGHCQRQDRTQRAQDQGQQPQPPAHSTSQATKG